MKEEITLRYFWSLLLSLAVLASACAAPAVHEQPRPASDGVAGPQNTSPRVQSSPAVVAPTNSQPSADVGLLAGRVVSLIRAARANPEQMRWAGVDEENRIVLAAAVDSDGMAAEQFQLAKWLGKESPDRLLMFTQEFKVTRPQRAPGSLTTLSKDRYRSWPPSSSGSPPFGEGEWSRYSDLRAERNGLLDTSDIEGLVQRWIQQRLGRRLVSFHVQEVKDAGTSLPNEVRRVGKLRIRADARSQQERVLEATILAAVPIFASGLSATTVEYEDVARVRTVQVTWSGLIDWARNSGDAADLVSWVSVDGQTDRSKRVTNGDSSSKLTLQELAGLLRKRPELKKLLPDGARITLGSGLFDDGIALLEGDIPAARSWEEAWSLYHEAVEALFAAEKALDQIFVIVKRENEVEFHWLRRWQWQTLTHLSRASDGKLDAAVLPALAVYYDRYTIVSR